MISPKICPKCKGEMKFGNYTGSQIEWEKEQRNKFLKNEGFVINTYACVKCGYLESYVNG